MAIFCAYFGRSGSGRLFVRLLPDRLRLLSSLLHALGTRASHYYCSITASRRSDRDFSAIAKIQRLRGSLDCARDDRVVAVARYFISSTERLRLISRVILRWRCAGMPVTRRGRILPLSVTNFFKRSGFL